MNRSSKPHQRILPCIPALLAAVALSILGTIFVMDLVQDGGTKQVSEVVIPVTGTVEVPGEAVPELPTGLGADLPDGEGAYPEPVQPVAPGSSTPAVSTLYLPLATQAPRLFGPQGLQLRPYAPGSAWNTPIGSNPQVDPHSTDMVATIGMDNEGRITSDPDQYSYPVYYAYDTTPRWDIPCTRYKCTIVTPNGTSTHEELKNVPIPADASPSEGTDGQMIIIDTTNNTEYDLWQVARTSNGWSVSNASVYNITWDGTPARFGSRGAGVPYLAGLVRPVEIDQGKIEHAIAFAYSHAAEDRCVFPASKTDGQTDMQYAIPQGARLQLDPSLTEADFDRFGLSRTGKIIARALQQYGMILIDNSGRPKIYVENLKDNSFSKRQWSDPDLDLDSTTIASIPYTFFRVLKLPEFYWNEGKQGPMHGDCFFDPALSTHP